MIDVNKVKGRIKELGLTQANVADEVGMDISTFNRKINDADGRYMTTGDAKLLATVLRIENPIPYFFC